MTLFITLLPRHPDQLPAAGPSLLLSSDSGPGRDPGSTGLLVPPAWRRGRESQILSSHTPSHTLNHSGLPSPLSLAQAPHTGSMVA